jgi:hypothetical protein
MDQIFQDYLLYYESRMKRREKSDVYTHSYQSEKALYDLVASCSGMEELQGKADAFRALTVQNAVALVKDQETYRKKVYEDCKEFIRAKGPVAILEKIDGMNTDMELVTMVNKAMQENSIEITVDQLLNFFYADFTAMENYEVYQQANIPGEWQADCKQYAQDILESGKKLWQENQLPEARQWKAGWVLDYNLLNEERHRRLIPVNDEELKKKIALHKIYKPS